MRLSQSANHLEGPLRLVRPPTGPELPAVVSLQAPLARPDPSLAMYSASHPTSSTSMNGVRGTMVDGAGTINPAALDPAVLSNASAVLANATSPRGVKRSRSPESYGDLSRTGEGEGEDGEKPRKRGRPTKGRTSDQLAESPHQVTPQQTPTSLPPVRTPQGSARPPPPPETSSRNTPTQVSPPKATPTKSVVKALPTVRDHTTDQLGPEGDEYIPREYDEAGEKKVSPNGHPLEGREYRCRTFLVPNRGNKLFMLATECARVLGYRDSYLLFNKNRSLFKIIASQAEKDDLIHQEILPYSYRSRQIAIVTAKSMFRQFGSRVVTHGRRVRDDYWEGKARKQGFTEEDLAGEKRPGAAKARDAAAAEAASTLAAVPGHADVVYSAGPAPLDAHLAPQTVTSTIMATGGAGLAPLPMIQTDDPRLRDYGNVSRPRQEISGPPYQDRIQPSSTNDLLNQAQQAADFNKALTQQRAVRGRYMDDFWNKPRDPKVAPMSQQIGTSAEQSSTVLPHPSPPLTAGGYYGGEAPPPLPVQPRAPPQMVGSHGYAPPPPHHPSPLGHSPLKNLQGSVRPDSMHQRSPGMALGSAGSLQSGMSYGVPHQSHMWPPPQQLQSPLAQPHHSLPQYSPHQQQPSPHQQPSQPASLQPSGPPLHYQSLAGMGPGSYPSSAGRNLYQVGTGPQQYIHPSTSSSQPGLQGWAPSPQNPPAPQGWGWNPSG